MTTESWINTFKKETIDIAKMDINTLSYKDSADRMRKLLQTGKITWKIEMIIGIILK